MKCHCCVADELAVLANIEPFRPGSSAPCTRPQLPLGGTCVAPRLPAVTRVTLLGGCDPARRRWPRLVVVTLQGHGDPKRRWWPCKVVTPSGGGDPAWPRIVVVTPCHPARRHWPRPASAPVHRSLSRPIPVLVQWCSATERGRSPRRHRMYISARVAVSANQSRCINLLLQRAKLQREAKPLDIRGLVVKMPAAMCLVLTRSRQPAKPCCNTVAVRSVQDAHSRTCQSAIPV